MSNVICFTGTVGRDAEVRFLSSGQAVLTVSVANNVGFGDKQKTNWFRVSVWDKRKTEGKIKDFLVKGQQVFISGELSQHEYESNGQTKTSLEINATIIDLVGSKGPAPQSAHHEQKSNGYAPETKRDNFDAHYDDDIPF